MSETDIVALPTFRERTLASLETPGLGQAVMTAVMRQYEGRLEMLPELGDSLAVRELAAKIKDHTLQHLDEYLALFADRVRTHGGQVHFARTGDQACEIIRGIARDTDARLIVKAKSMVSEEIQLAGKLEADGIEVVETDLGEFIVQVSKDHPSHIVTPVIHKTTKQIAALFQKVLRIPYTEDPEALTKAARQHLREKFRKADMGICGCNFAVAETGTIVIVTNEGNGRLSTSRPRVVVALMGMEKLVPGPAEMAVMLKLLARSATGQRMTIYTNLLTGPKRRDDLDGPEEFHVVIMDGGRSRILAGKYRETLRCIRCGACLNACPVYRTIGGHAYGSVYPGPIGKLITPLLMGQDEFKDLPNASSLCNACFDACPVRIRIPELLIEMRNDQRRAGKMHWFQRLGFRLWRMGMMNTFFYRFGSKMARFFGNAAATDGWHTRLPPPFDEWTKHRDFPAMADKPFHEMWDEIEVDSRN